MGLSPKEGTGVRNKLRYLTGTHMRVIFCLRPRETDITNRKRSHSFHKSRSIQLDISSETIAMVCRIPFLLVLLAISATADDGAKPRYHRHDTRFEEMGKSWDTIHGLHDAATNAMDKEPCLAACEDSEAMYPAPKNRIRPYSNGCTLPPDLESEFQHTALKEELGDCCDLHDACYFSCGVSKEFCDQDFHKCTVDICKEKKDPKEKERCRIFSMYLIQGHQYFGCAAYTEQQQEHCDCVSHDDAIERVRVYAQEFYHAYNQTHDIPEHFLTRFLDHHHTAPAEKRMSKHGELIFRLYKQYPQSIEIISRDGTRKRHEEKYFDPQEAEPEL